MSSLSFTRLLGKKPSLRRVKYFSILCSLGLLANLLSVNLPFVIPFLIGNVVFITLQIRFGTAWALLALIIVMSPVSEALFWLLAFIQLLCVGAFNLKNTVKGAVALLTYSGLAPIAIWFYGPAVLIPDWQHFFLVLTILVLLFALYLRASEFLLALSASSALQKKQHLQQQLSQRIALYSAIPGSLFVALILHIGINLHLSSLVEYYKKNQQHRDAELTRTLREYKANLALTSRLMDQTNAKVVLTHLTQMYSEFTSALVTDKDGVVINFFSDGRQSIELNNINVSHRYYFAYPAATGKPVITDSFEGVALGNYPIFAISHPLFDSGNFSGVLEASVPLNRLNSIFQPHLREYEYYLLLDKEGKKIWGSNERSTLGAEIPSTPRVSTSINFLQSHLSKKTDVLRFTQDYSHLIIDSQNELTGWLHLDKISIHVFSLRYHLYLLLAMLVSVLMLEIISRASSRFARSYTLSLEQIAKYAENWQLNDTLSTPPPKLLSSSIEFETVLHNLSKLKERVSDAYHQLSTLLALRTELNNELELRVSERTQELKEERDRAQHLANVKSRFLANMSHEIRTPITVIKGFSEQLLKNTNLAEQQEFAKLIYQNTLHLQHVIDDILDTSKIDEGKLSFESKHFNLYLFLLELKQSIEPIAKAKKLQLDLIYDVADNIMLETDPFRLRQIMHNLLSNAVKFTAKGKIDLVVAIEKEYLTLTVCDQGIGLSAEQISQLFQAFQQADNSTSRRFGGTGLGLYISQNLAKLMGMTLEVTSELGSGSRFKLLLPLSILSATEPVDNNPIELARDCAEPQLHGHILIVDDVPDIRALLIYMIKATNLTFKVAANGKEAINLTQQESFDLILMDQQMPEMDGITATKALRSRGFHKPIVRLSADVYDNEYLAEAHHLFDATLVKPIDKVKLHETLSKLLNIASTPLQTHIAAEGNKDDEDHEFLELQVQYLQYLKQHRNHFQKLFSDSNFEALQIELHKIKGTSASLELFEIAEAAKSCEQAIKEGHCSEILFHAFLNSL